jgi:hypothetical protein
MASGSSNASSSNAEKAPAPSERPYQPVFLESLTLPRQQRTGHSPLDNPQYMHPKEKLKMFFFEQPLIPLGLTATVGFFVYGLGHFVIGKSPQTNWKYAVSSLTHRFSSSSVLN